MGAETATFAADVAVATAAIAATVVAIVVVDIVAVDSVSAAAAAADVVASIVYVLASLRSLGPARLRPKRNNISGSTKISPFLSSMSNPVPRCLPY